MKSYESFTLKHSRKMLKIELKKISDDQAAEYHKNTMRNIRSALNRHMKDIGRLVDIAKDNDFKTSNAMLNSKMK